MYAPEVQIHIRTASGQIIDVSDDLVQGTVQRITSMAGAGGVSSVRFTLANSRRKYDGVFSPMGLVVVYMRRIKKMLVFTGYLDVVPAFTVFPGPVDLQASCTMKRLQYWMWDPDTTAAQGLLNDKNEQYRNLPDAGMARKTIDLLTKVTGWQKDRIHIGKVPTQWFDAVAKMAAAAEAEAEKAQMLAAVGASSYQNGSASKVAGTTVFDPGPAPPGADLPATTGRISAFGGPNGGAYGNFALTGESGVSPNPWYCAMRWHYVLWDPVSQSAPTHPNPLLSPTQVGAAMAWLRNRHILVENPDTGKAVVVRAADAGPAKWTGFDIDMDPKARDYVGVQGTTCNISWAPPDWPLGPVKINRAEQTVGTQLNAANISAGDPAGQFGNDVIAYAGQFLGVPYVWGGTSLSKGSDCSGFVMEVMKHFNISLPHYTEDQYNVSSPIDPKEAGAGDLVFFHVVGETPYWGHVGLYMGNGMMMDEPHTGGVAEVVKVWGSVPNIEFRRVSQYAGGVVDPRPYIGGSGVSKDNLARINGTPADYSTGNATSATAAAQVDPYEALFNVYDWVGFQLTGLGDYLGGARALMNDQPISQTVDSMMSAALRVYCSAPNGDFIAWFPDYFGWWKIAAKMVIRDIELLDFSVGWSDSSLKTHYYVTSATSGLTNDAGSPAQMVSTAGIATVEMADLMKVIFGGDISNYPGIPADVAKAMKKDEGAWSKWMLQRFGARPAFEPMQNITGSRQEFFFACFRFMQNWASQYAASIRTTFMPEVYPGMIVVLPTYNFQAYVTDVTHDFSLQQGGGFNTTINVVAPSSIGKSGVPGLPRGGPL